MPTRDELEAVRERPDLALTPGEMQILRCFDDCSTKRHPTDYGLPPIPWDNVRDWGIEHGLPYRVRLQLWHVIRLVDFDVRRREAAARKKT